MHIGIIGIGYVGLVTGACFSEFGVSVTCYDKDENRIKQLKRGEIPFYEPGLEDLVRRNMEKGRLQFTSNVADAVKDPLVIFIAVGTPPRGDGSTDLSYIEQVAIDIAKHMDSYKVIVTKSTVPIGTGKRLSEIISKNSRKKVEFDIASNPEFLREGSAIEEFMNPSRVVIGAKTEHAVAILKDLYKPLYIIETPFIICDIETAELIKHASNSFLAAKISFINEMANLCEQVGADVHLVAKGMGLDNRIGPDFLLPGPGFGGSCLPKDLKALIRIAEGHGIDMKIIRAALETNEAQLKRMVVKIKSIMKTLKGKSLAVLGLSFKPNTDDMRDAPATFIIQSLLRVKADIRAYDPAAMHNARSIMPDITYADNPYDAAEGAHAVVILTEWNEFRSLELERLRKLLKTPYFFDLRNVYEPERMRKLGFKYFSVGR